jgi:hypothetical protein
MLASWDVTATGGVVDVGDARLTALDPAAADASGARPSARPAGRRRSAVMLNTGDVPLALVYGHDGDSVLVMRSGNAQVAVWLTDPSAVRRSFCDSPDADISPHSGAQPAPGRRLPAAAVRQLEGQLSELHGPWNVTE